MRSTELGVRQLRLVVAVADAGTLPAAARRLGMAHTTLGVQLRRIEAAVGRDLFQHALDGVTVTDAGRDLVRHARGVLRGIDRMVDEATRAGAGRVVRIATNRPLDGVLTELHRRRPDARWTVLPGGPDACRAAVGDGAADVALVARTDGGPVGDGDGLVVRTGHTVRFHVLLPAAHPLAADPLVDLLHLAGDRWVTGSGPQDPVLRECRAAGLEPDVAFRVPDPGTAHLLVREGLAVTIAAPGPALPPGVVPVPYRGAGGVTWQVLRRHAPEELVEDVLAALAADDGGRAWADRGASVGVEVGTPRRPLRLGGPPGPVTAGLPAQLRPGGLVCAVSHRGVAPLVAELGTGRLDLGLHHDYPGLGAEPGRTPPDVWPDVTEVAVEPLTVVLPPGHRLSGRPGLTPAELAGEPWVLPVSPFDRLDAAVLALFDRSGVPVRVVAGCAHAAHLYGLLVTHDALSVAGAVPPDERLELVPLVHPHAHRRAGVLRRGAFHAEAAVTVAQAWRARLLDLAHPAALPGLDMPGTGR